MSLVVSELLKEHAEILAALDRVRQLGLASSREALFGLRDLLRVHLARENAFLYPPLQALAGDRPRLRVMLADFDEENTRLLKGVEAFFAQYTSESRDGIACATALGSLAADLRQRIHREEKVLYPEFDARTA
jgi:iron-sulfur cluster repair protein YtfE (RIC family)